MTAENNNLLRKGERTPYACNFIEQRKNELKAEAKRHTLETKQILKDASLHLIDLNIFPSVEIAVGDKLKREKLLHIAENPGTFYYALSTQYYLKPDGSIVFDYGKIPNKITRENNLTEIADEDYSKLSKQALSKIEETVHLINK